MVVRRLPAPARIRSDPVRGAGHDPRGRAHGVPNDRGQRCAARGLRASGVASFVGAHPFEEGAASAVSRREPCQVVAQVLDHLALGLGDEPEAPSVPGKPGRGADGERACIPEGVEPARRRPELFEPCPAPGEMIALLARRLIHRRSDRRIARRQRLATVEGLGRDLSRMVDPHQPRGTPAFALAENVVRGAGGGVLRLLAAGNVARAGARVDIGRGPWPGLAIHLRHAA